MIERYTQNNITWIDILNPTTDEIREILEECGIPRGFGNDLTVLTSKTEVVSKKGLVKITLGFPIVKRTDIHHPHEVKFLVTKTHLLTIRFEEIESLHNFGKEYEVLCMVGSAKNNITADRLFITMLNFLYDAMYKKLDYLESRLKDIEEEIFNEHEKEMVFELSVVSRKLITFRQTISAHEIALAKLQTAMIVAFTPKSGQYIEELEHHYRNLMRQVYALMSMLQDLRDTNNSLVSTKQNETMKMFTILAFITFPLTLFTSMFGMNTVATPILGIPGDFWIILSIMVVVSITFFVFFKYKKWM